MINSKKIIKTIICNNFHRMSDESTNIIKNETFKLKTNQLNILLNGFGCSFIDFCHNDFLILSNKYIKSNSKIFNAFELLFNSLNNSQKYFIYTYINYPISGSSHHDKRFFIFNSFSEKEAVEKIIKRKLLL